MPRLYSLFTLAVSTVFSINVYPDVRISMASAHRPDDPYKRVYYSNTQQNILLNVQGQVPGQCNNIVAGLLQLSTKLTAEIDTRTVLDCERSMVEYWELVSGPLEFGFTVPEVKRKTEFRWEFSDCSNGNCNPAGKLEFTALPENFLDPLKQWSNDNILYIYDKRGMLQDFLDDKDISYLESGNLLPKNALVITVLVIENPDFPLQDKLPESLDNNIIIIHEYPTDLPVIYDKTSSVSHLVDVHMPLVGRLSEDAAAQKLFLELFYMLSPTGIKRESPLILN